MESPSVDRLYRSIVDQEDDVFYRSQQRGEPDLTQHEKVDILKDLFEQKPAVFLQRYHRFVAPCFIGLFDREDYVIDHYLKKIETRLQEKAANAASGGAHASKKARNRRFLQLRRLQKDGKYFSYEQMREREPALFDSMIGQHLDDEEKLCLRPTVDRPEGTWSRLMQEFDDAGRISNRRKRQLEDAAGGAPQSKFVSHVEGRMASLDDLEQVEGLNAEDEAALRDTFPSHCALGEVDSIVAKFRKTDVSDAEPTSSQKIHADDAGADELADHDSSDDEQYPKDLLKVEFTSIMERRFLDGLDGEFVDYDDSEDEIDEIRERDLEEAYYDDI